MWTRDNYFSYRYEGALDPWMSALWKIMYEKNHELLPKGPDFEIADATLIDQPRVQIMYHQGNGGVPPRSTTTGLIASLTFTATFFFLIENNTPTYFVSYETKLRGVC